MTSIITGDVINSRNTDSSVWLPELKKVLEEVGESPTVWEIYRGDSFQVEVAEPKDVLEVAFKLKAAIKTIKKLDVRMSIGLGDKSYSATSITESNGSAFANSGDGFEQLQRARQTLMIKSDFPDFDEEMNLYLRLLLISMDNWTAKSAEYVTLNLQQEMTQEEVAKKLNIGQSAVSERHQRSCYNEMKEVDARFRKQLQSIL